MEVSTLRRLCEVPEELTVSEWADRYRILPESSTSPGEFRTSRVPYARRWMDLGADPSVERIVLCWGAQLIKSTVIENILAYRICRMPSPMMVIRPKIDDAENWMKKRFVPMVRQTPALRERVILKRSTNTEENSATLRMKSFPGGFLFAASATSGAELRSWSSPLMAMDEIDAFEDITDGDPVVIARGRKGAAEVAQEILTSTPLLADGTRIWPLLEAGTYERYAVPCYRCSHKQFLVWGGPSEPSGFKWPQGKPKLAEYQCEQCGERFTWSQYREELMQQGEWRPTNPDGEYPSSHLPAWYSPFALSSWGQIAKEFDESHGRPQAFQGFVNLRMAECWSETVSRVEVNELAKRLEPDLEEGKVPVGVGLVTIGVDGQKRYLQWQAWGWGAGLESWLIASGMIEGETETEPGTPGGPWEALDEILKAGFTHVNGRHVPVRRTFIDSGFATSQVYRYCKLRSSWRVFPSKGVAGDRPVFVGKPSTQGKDKVLLYSVSVDKAKDEFLRNHIHILENGPGKVHLPGWVSPEELAGLVSEEKKRKAGLRGRISWEWGPKKNAAPNEPLDCRNYARGAVDVEGARVLLVLGDLAKALAEPPEPEPEPAKPDEEAPPSPYRRRGNWVTGW